MPTVSVTYKGAFFTGNGPDEVRQAIENTIKESLAVGEMKVREQLYVGHGRLIGHYRSSVHGELKDSLHGRIHDSEVVYGPWLEGVSSRNKKSRFKGYAMFRNAKQALQKMIGGILNKHVGRAVKNLGG